MNTAQQTGNAANNVVTLTQAGRDEAPAREVPSISASAMLVEMQVSQWSGKKLDKGASEAVTTGNSAKKGVARVHKDLMADCEELKAIHKFTSTIRTQHYVMTLPWSDTGLRILPTAQYFRYTEQMNTLQTEFYELVERFLSAYQWKIAQAHAALGGLFNPDEYPTEQALRTKFSLSLAFIPLPDAGDWRVDIGKQGNEQLRDHYQQFYKQALKEAMNDVWKRAHDALGRMSERLDYTDSIKKVFRDSLVENVTELVDIMDSCNITQDPVMSEAADTLRDTLRGVDADDLRKDAALRRATKKRVDEVLATLPTLF